MLSVNGWIGTSVTQISYASGFANEMLKQARLRLAGSAGLWVEKKRR